MDLRIEPYLIGKDIYGWSIVIDGRELEGIRPALAEIGWSKRKFEEFLRNQYEIYTNGHEIYFFNEEDALQAIEWIKGYKVFMKLSEE